MASRRTSPRPTASNAARPVIDGVFSNAKAPHWSRQSRDFWIGRVPAMVHSVDEAGRLLAVSDRWLEKLGYRRADVLGRTATDFLTPASREWAMQLVLSEFFDAGSCENLEFEMVCADGRVLDVLLSAVVNPEIVPGEGRSTIAVITDVSSQKHVAAALAESESRLRMITATMHDLVICLNFEFEWVYVSPGSFSMVGYYPEELLGDTPQSFADPRDWPRVHAAFEDLMAGGAPDPIECRAICKDGSLKWLESTLSVDPQNRLIVSVQRDITKRKAMQQALEESEQRVSVAADSGRIGIWEWDVIADTMVWDEWMDRFFDVTEGDRRAKRKIWIDRVHPDDLVATDTLANEALAGTAMYDTEYRVTWRDGSTRQLRAAGQIIRDAAGQAVRMVGSNWDVTEQRQLAAALAHEHELLRVTLESIGDGVITTDRQGRVAWLNPVAERMTGWSVAAAAGQNFETVFNIVHARTREPARDVIHACLQRGQITGVAEHTVLISRDGSEYGIADSAAPIRRAGGELLGMVLVFQDVTEQRRLAGEISYRASHDPLTGLLNRSEFDARMHRLVPKIATEHSANALFFIDLDQFKIVNDTAGHAVGDRLLTQVAKLLAEVVRASDTIARLGGDEFAVILEHCPPGPALALAQRICDRMDEFRFAHGDRWFRIGASVGMVVWDERWTAVAPLVQAADSACFAAKEAGRNQVHLWSDTNKELQARLSQTQWAARLEQALDGNQFVLFAQRIAPLAATAAGVHAEVLLRLPGDDGALLSPGAFLPAAERFHMASRIDRWVLARVIAWVSTRPALDWLTTLSVNLSGQSIKDHMFHSWAVDRLAEAGPIFCSKLCLEITETAAITNLADAATFIAEMRRLGVRVALDDFGAGASSFGYLKSMPVDYLKIDGQFIRDLLTDPLDQAAVRCFVEVAGIVGMRTIAEFVDHPEIMDRLQSMGIDYAQGYHVHHPSPIEELATH